MAEDVNENRRDENRWTPELWLRLFKEGITALIGLLIVGSTVLFAFRALTFAGKPAEMAVVKDMLTLIMGLAGVVLGYYFGRIPAESRADAAQAQADSAIAQSAAVSAQADALADKVGEIIELSPAASPSLEGGSRGSARGVADEAEGQVPLRVELQGMRDQLRTLAASSRRIR